MATPRRNVQFQGLDWDQEEQKSIRGYESRKQQSKQRSQQTKNATSHQQRAKTDAQQRRMQVMVFADYLCGDMIDDRLRQEIVAIPILSSLNCICKHVAMEHPMDPDPIIPDSLLERLQLLRSVLDVVPSTHSAFCLFEAWMRHSLRRGIYQHRNATTTRIQANQEEIEAILTDTTSASVNEQLPERCENSSGAKK